MKNPLVRYILGVVERYGLPSDEVLTRWRLETNRSNEPNSDDLAPLFRAMASLRPEDADLGLHVGECVPLQAFNPVIYLVLSSASLARSIGAAIRFGEVLEGRASKMWTRPRGDAQIVGWSELAPDGHEDRHHHEFIAVALVNDPVVLFLDEPTTGLDPQARRQLWALVKKIQADGSTIMLTTHYMEEAEELCDRIAVVENGEIIALDTPDALIDQLLETGFKPEKRVREAPLDDVFLNLTGRDLRD